MDVRLFKKGYGRIFVKSLPASPVTRDIRDIEQFYAESAGTNITEVNIQGRRRIDGESFLHFSLVRAAIPMG